MSGTTLRIKLVAIEGINLKPGEEIDTEIRIQSDNFGHQEIRKGLVLTAVVLRQAVRHRAVEALKKLFETKDRGVEE